MPDYQLHLGDNLATLKTYPDNHFDSIVTDPPYGIKFLGKDWDSKKATETTSKIAQLHNLPSGMAHTSLADDLEFQYWMKEVFTECRRVLKPGGYLLAFSAARTYHHMAMAAQTAGFEVRDQLMWLYSSGFPKAQDIGKAIQKRLGVEETKDRKTNGASYGGRSADGTIPVTMNASQDVVLTSPTAQQWEGFKTALKPAHEPIVMARKPFRGSTIDNVLKNGLGAMNIDATRVPWADADPLQEWQQKYPEVNKGSSETFSNILASSRDQKKKRSDRPVINVYQNTSNLKLNMETQESASGDYAATEANTLGRYPSNVIGEVAEGYQKYFYCPKVSRKERHTGFEAPDTEPLNNPEDMKNHPLWDPSIGTNSHRLMAKIREATAVGNNHPTVKPVALMDYLIKLVTPPSTPELQRRVLDPFMGSGSTGMAATALGHHFTGCDLDPNYVKIAKTRIEAWNQDTDTDSTTFDDLFE